MVSCPGALAALIVVVAIAPATARADGTDAGAALTRRGETALLFALPGLTNRSALGGTVAVRRFVRERIAARLDLTYSRRDNDETSTQTRQDAPFEYASSRRFADHATHLHGQLVLERHFAPGRRIRPYAGGGLGLGSDRYHESDAEVQHSLSDGMADSVTYSDEERDRTTSVDVLASGGLECAITRHVALAGEYRLGYTLSLSRYRRTASQTFENPFSSSSDTKTTAHDFWLRGGGLFVVVSW